MLAHLQGLLTADEARQLRETLMPLSFDDGKRTATGDARRRKNNLQLDPEHPEAKRWSSLIHEKLSRSTAFAQISWPRLIQPFRFCRYDVGMSYGDHVDLPSMGEEHGRPMRTDLSMTLFLSPLNDYDGGQLVLHEDQGIKKVRGAPGDAVIYPTHYVHRVEPVTRGTRLVAISWVESRIRDPRDRQLLYDMGRSMAVLEKKLETDPSASVGLLRLKNCVYQLTRRWLE